ncbi:ABC transporter substrate-binding protein [Alkaliphilus transvaalensis]|uniref:ABC transporter substrate-binding protein n=1 Tax=Alkaliphilus transvaalensis TaxID=114628 RepID=UPI00047B4B66|nr:ABC transporter substrate-binding protein [Alkaliphilus transvaalensis]
MIKRSKKLVSLSLLLVLILLAGCQGSTVTPTTSNEDSAPIEGQQFRLVESDGTELILDDIPERIVVLSVATAEIMHSLGIPLVGITTTSRELSEELKKLPDVGIPMTPDMERIAALNPDLVIMSTNFKGQQAENFKHFNLNAFFLDNQKYSDTQKSIEMLAEAFGKEEKIEEILKPIKEREEALLKNVTATKKPRVMVMFGSGESFTMARNNSFVGEMVMILGGENVTDDLDFGEDMASMVPISIEEVVKFDPEIILRISHGNPRQVQRQYEAEFESNAVWHEINAVKNNRVHDLETELFFANPGLNAIDALEVLAEILYP